MAAQPSSPRTPAAQDVTCRHPGCKNRRHAIVSRTYDDCVEHLSDEERVDATNAYADDRNQRDFDDGYDGYLRLGSEPDDGYFVG